MLSRILIKNDTGNYVHYTSSSPSPKKYAASPFSLIRPLPERIGTGHFSSFSINEGLSLGICHGRFQRDYTSQITSKGPLFFFVFSMKGRAISWNPSLPDPVIMAPGRSSAYFFEDPVYERMIKGQQNVLSLAIRVSPDFLTQLVNPMHFQESQYNDTVEKIIENQQYYVDDLMTSQMKIIFSQILNNPYKERISRIYLESKALELIALKLAQIDQSGCSVSQHTTLLHKERKLICQARELLIGNLQSPPSLKNLANQIGMSHTRLNKGFRTVFGCTVFEYLRKERLCYARMLIEEKTVDLTMVAFESGFCSSSHFAASFLKEYGLRPSEYRKALSEAIP